MGKGRLTRCVDFLILYCRVEAPCGNVLGLFLSAIWASLLQSSLLCITSTCAITNTVSSEPAHRARKPNSFWTQAPPQYTPPARPPMRGGLQRASVSRTTLRHPLRNTARRLPRGLAPVLPLPSARARRRYARHRVA
jgi:hypothetical protein